MERGHGEPQSGTVRPILRDDLASTSGSGLGRKAASQTQNAMTIETLRQHEAMLGAHRDHWPWFRKDRWRSAFGAMMVAFAIDPRA